MQQRYALALMGNAQLEESRRYLNEEWSGKKKERLYKQTVLNLDLVEAYQQQDADRYNELYDRADRSIKRNKLFGAEKLFLEHQYKQAIDFLEGYRVRTAYDKVIRSYILGQCYDNLGDRKMRKTVCSMYWNMEIQCPARQRQRSGSSMTENNRTVNNHYGTEQLAGKLRSFSMKEGEKNVGAIFESLQIYRGEDCYAADGQHVSVCCGGGKTADA